MPTVGALNIKLSTDIRDATAGFAAIEKRVQSFGTTVRNNLMPSFLGGKLGGVGIGDVVPWAGRLGSMAGAAALVGEIASSMKQLAIEARAADVSIEDFQRFSNIARKAGADFGAVDSAMDRLTRTIGEAMLGSEQAVTAFTRLGLSAVQLSSMTDAQRLEAVAKALQQISNEAVRAAIAQNILGRQAGQLKVFLEDLAAGKSGGIIYPTEYVTAWSDLGTQIAKVGRAIKAVPVMIGGEMLHSLGLGRPAESTWLLQQRAEEQVEVARKLSMAEQERLRRLEREKVLNDQVLAILREKASLVQSISSSLKEQVAASAPLKQGWMGEEVGRAMQKRRDEIDEAVKAMDERLPMSRAHPGLYGVRGILPQSDANVAALKQMEANADLLDKRDMERAANRRRREEFNRDWLERTRIEDDHRDRQRAIETENARRASTFAYAPGATPGSAEFRDLYYRALHGARMSETKPLEDKLERSNNLLFQLTEQGKEKLAKGMELDFADLTR